MCLRRICDIDFNEITAGLQIFHGGKQVGAVSVRTEQSGRGDSVMLEVLRGLKGSRCRR